LWGHQADRKPAVKLSPMKPQKEGACAERALTRPMISEDLTARLKIYSKKDAPGNAARLRPEWLEGDGQGDARSIAALPGAAARAPIKQDCDVRL
jgi:hypothetical protein